MKKSICLALAMFASGVQADPGWFEIVLDTPRAFSSEDRALHGLVVLNDGVANARAVGTIGRAFSMSSSPNNTIWGVVTEAINFPAARGNVVGLETAIVNMTHDNVGELRGIDVVFKNRLDASWHEAVPVVGANRFNADSAAVFVSAQPRSPAGEYSGWQAGVKFARDSLDRSATRPYAAAIDVSDVQAPAPLYLLVWRCGQVKCGLAPTSQGAAIVVDIENK